MTRIYNIIYFIVFLSSIGCGNKVHIEDFNQDIWKEDKMGCHGERIKMMDVLSEVQKKALGMKRNEILYLFGNPESTELHPRGQLLYRYYITPSINCQSYDPDQQMRYLEIRINALGIVSEIMVNGFFSNDPL